MVDLTVTINCTAHGLARDQALAIGVQKLETKFTDHPLHSEFKLAEEQFDPSDSSWMFSFRANACVVAIIIDKCGVSDIGGLSKSCL